MPECLFPTCRRNGEAQYHGYCVGHRIYAKPENIRTENGKVVEEKRGIPHNSKPGLSLQVEKKGKVPAKKKPRKAIKKKSLNKKELDKILKVQYPIFLKAHPECEMKTEDCTRVATVVHHTKGRGPKEVLDQATWKASCTACNSWVEAHHAQAEEMGLKISRHKKVN